MTESGEVVDIEKGKAYIMFKRTSMCKNCGACGITAKSDNVVLSLENTLNAQIGDIVLVQFTGKNALLSSFIAYGIPLLMLFAGILIGYALPYNISGSKDAAAAVCGLIACALGFLILKLLNPYFKKKLGNAFSMVDIRSNAQ